MEQQQPPLSKEELVRWFAQQEKTKGLPQALKDIYSRLTDDNGTMARAVDEGDELTGKKPGPEETIG